MVNTLVEKLADTLERNNVIQSEEREIYEYGIEVLINNVVLMGIIFVIGLFLRKIEYTLLFMCFFPLIRKYTGGYHAPKRWQCFVLTNLIHLGIIGLEYLSNTTMNEQVITMMLLFSLCIIFIVDPIENANNPKTPEEIAKNKKIGQWIIGILAVISFLGFYLIKDIQSIFFTLATVMCAVTSMMLPDYFKNGGI